MIICKRTDHNRTWFLHVAMPCEIWVREHYFLWNHTRCNYALFRDVPVKIWVLFCKYINCNHFWFPRVTFCEPIFLVSLKSLESKWYLTPSCCDSLWAVRAALDVFTIISAKHWSFMLCLHMMIKIIWILDYKANLAIFKIWAF